MKKIYKFVTIGVLILAGCTFRLQPQVSLQTIDDNKEKIPILLFLQIPEDFADYEYVGSYEGREIRYYFGKATANILPDYMKSMFASVSVTDNYVTRPNCDFLAIPEWGQSNSYVKPFVFGVETNIKVQFMNCDKSKMFSVFGKGEGTAGIYLEPALMNAGNSALNGALQNLRDKIRAKKELFQK